MDDDLRQFVNAAVHAYVPLGEPDSAQQIARMALTTMLANLWAATPQYPPPADVRACIAEAEIAGRAREPDFVFEYDPLLAGVKCFDWSALAA